VSQAQHRQVSGTNHCLVSITLFVCIFALVVLAFDYLPVVVIDQERNSVVGQTSIQQHQS